jgi:hypothetical protein
MIMTSHTVHVEDPLVHYHPVLEEYNEGGNWFDEWRMGYSDESNFGISGDRRTIKV